MRSGECVVNSGSAADVGRSIFGVVVVANDVYEAEVCADFCHTGYVGTEGFVEVAGQEQFVALGLAGLQECEQIFVELLTGVGFCNALLTYHTSLLSGCGARFFLGGGGHGSITYLVGSDDCNNFP